MKLQQLIGKWSPQWHPAINQIIRENELYEGLIFSYSLDKTMASIYAFLSQYGNVKFNPDNMRNLIVVECDHSIVKVLPSVMQSLERTINTCGWFIAMVNVITFTDPHPYTFKTIKDVFNHRDIINRTEKIGFLLEAKYGVEVSEKEKQQITALYHATPSKNVPRILHHGLTPRSQSKIAKHPERIYLAIDRDDAEDFAEMSKEVKPEGEFTILKIDRGAISKIRLFNDPAFVGALYTLSSIAPQYISVDEKPKIARKFLSMFRSV